MNSIDFASLKTKNGKINWKMNIGVVVPFTYNEHSGALKILKYHGEKITYEYNDCEHTQAISCFKSAMFGKLFGLGEYKYGVGEIVETKTGFVKILEHTSIKYGKNKVYKAYKYVCEIDGNTDTLSESNLTQGKGCNVCSNNKVKVGVNDVATTHPHLAKYLNNIEDAYTHTYGTKDYVTTKCPHCGETKVVMMNYLHSSTFSCHRCSDGVSYPNKLMFNILKQLEVEFIAEYSPDWIGKKRYDFYIPSKKLIIEMDGGWHYKDNNMSGLTFEESKSIDIKKEKIAINKGLLFERIDCRVSSIEYIKNNILNSTIPALFNIECVNWSICHEKSIGSNVKEACDLWNGGMYNTYDIAKNMNMSPSGVWIYLKTGHDCGLCDYTYEKATHYRVERSKVSQMHRRKKIRCIETGDIFDCAKDLEESSLKIFGVKLLQSNVRAVCNGYRPKHKGYTFEYV